MPKGDVISHEAKVAEIMTAIEENGARIVGYSFTDAPTGLTITFTALPQIEANGLLRFYLSATLNGNPVDLGDGIFEFKNPPVFLATPKPGKPNERNFTRNALLAIRAAIVRAVWTYVNRGI